MVSQSDNSGRHQRLKKLIQELRLINTKMVRVLERLPLSSHYQVEKLAKLSENQKRLMRSSSGTAPEAIKVFLDNEKHAARYIQMRYADAMKNGKLRKPK